LIERRGSEENSFPYTAHGKEGTRVNMGGKGRWFGGKKESDASQMKGDICRRQRRKYTTRMYLKKGKAGGGDEERKKKKLSQIEWGREKKKKEYLCSRTTGKRVLVGGGRHLRRLGGGKNLKLGRSKEGCKAGKRKEGETLLIPP